MNTEIITILQSDFLTPELAEKIAAAQWNRPDFADGIVSFVYDGKTETDCFNVIAQNERGDVVGRLFCLQNANDAALWYYGDLFVIPAYRRLHIAEKMLCAAQSALTERGCRTLRCYAERENSASFALQRKNGFMEQPYKTFNNLQNEGQLMFEKPLSPYSIREVATQADARYVTMIFNKNADALHCPVIMYSEWLSLLSADDPDEKHFLILLGAVPCGYMKINGLCGDVGWISVLAVEPSFQRHGIAGFAVDYAESCLRAAGKQRICVQTTQDNAAAQALYEKCGFAAVSETVYTTGDGINRAGIKYGKKL